MNPPFFWIYILECENGSFYTGYTKNLARRFRQHIDGTANVRYTRSHRPVRIAQCWRLYEPVGCALKVEKIIKAAGRAAKERIISDPRHLREITEGKLGEDVAIFTNEPAPVEQAARAIVDGKVKTAPDPFASACPVDL